MKKSIMLKIPEYRFKDGDSEWVHLMVEIGYWANLNADNNEIGKNTYITILVPTRQCCSQFILFGSVLASLENQKDNLSWQQFIELEEGTEIFCKELAGEKNEFNARAGNIEKTNDPLFKRIQVPGKNKLVIDIYELSFYEREISLIRPPNRLYEETLSSTVKYYREIFNNPLITPQANSCHNLLVTNQTQWIDRSRNISSLNDHKISDLLFLTSEANEQFKKVMLKSEEAYNNKPQRDFLRKDDSKVAILDGRKAVLEHYRFLKKQKNIIFLLEYNEYDDSCESMIKELMEDECRDSGLSLSLENFRADMNIQLMAFNYSYKEQDA